MKNKPIYLLPKLLLFLVLISFSIVNNTSAQTSTTKELKFSIQPNIEVVNSVGNIYVPDLHEKNKTSLKYELEANYSFFRDIDFGVYVAYSKLLHPYFDVYDNIHYSFVSSKAVFYGIKMKFHLMPLLFHQNNSRFDIYANVRTGFVNEYWRFAFVSDSYEHKKGFEIGGGLGISYMFSKHLGIFGEYSYGKFYNDDNSLLKGGLIFKF